MNAPKHQRRSRWTGLGYTLGAVVLLVAIGLLIRWATSGETAAPKKTVPEVVQLKLIQPPPPPPPPPPPKEPPKLSEAPRMREAVRNDAPPDNKPPSPDNKPAPPDQPPALDAPGTASNDGFGLAGKPGGGDFIGGGSGGTGGGGGTADPYGGYAALIQGHVRSQLQKNRELARARFRIGVEVWLDGQGRAQRVELIDSTGKAEVDNEIRQALLAMPPMPQSPPQNLPQPVVLQVASS